MTRPAGAFGQWLAAMQSVLRGERAADVPCDGCVGCCISGYPIPLRSSDSVALERVPERYLALPVGGGTARMGYRDDGTCPMLDAGRCTIYADRPQTCRDYDCRIYTAAGLLPDGERPVINERVQEWRFDYEDETARLRAAAVIRAARFIREHAALFPVGVRARSATAAAVLAVKVHGLFLEGEAGRTPEQLARAVLAAARAFDAGAPD